METEFGCPTCVHWLKNSHKLYAGIDLAADRYSFTMLLISHCPWCGSKLMEMPMTYWKFYGGKCTGDGRPDVLYESKCDIEFTQITKDEFCSEDDD